MCKFRLVYSFLIFLLLTLSACSRHPSGQAQGYIEGRYTYVATSVSGYLDKLFVKKGMQVRAGDPLFELNPRPEADAYLVAVGNEEQAEFNKQMIQPNLDFAKLTYERYKTLVPKNAIQQSQLDSARANYESLQRQLSQAQAAITTSRASLEQAKWIKEQKNGFAPVNATVFDTYYRIGEYTEAGKSILSLLAPVDIKVIFFVPESILGKLQLGQKVTVQCDGCAQQYSGTISFISPSAEYTPPVIYSTETTYKLIYRIEAVFTPQEAVQLHPGQPVMVRYN